MGKPLENSAEEDFHGRKHDFLLKERAMPVPYTGRPSWSEDPCLGSHSEAPQSVCCKQLVGADAVENIYVKLFV